MFQELHERSRERFRNALGEAPHSRDCQTHWVSDDLGFFESSVQHDFQRASEGSARAQGEPKSFNSPRAPRAFSVQSRLESVSALLSTFSRACLDRGSFSPEK